MEMIVSDLPPSHKLDQIESLHFFLFIHIFADADGSAFPPCKLLCSHLQFGDVYDGVTLSLTTMDYDMKNGTCIPIPTNSAVKDPSHLYGIRQVVTCFCDLNHHDYIAALQPTVQQLYSDVVIQNECLHVKCVNIVSKG